jgi:hypothetical protein
MRTYRETPDEIRQLERDAEPALVDRTCAGCGAPYTGHDEEPEPFLCGDCHAANDGPYGRIV